MDIDYPLLSIRCKVGDLAIVTRGDYAPLGLLVRIVRFAGTCKFLDMHKIRDAGNCWVVESLATFRFRHWDYSVFGQPQLSAEDDRYGSIPDDCLRPLPGIEEHEGDEIEADAPKKIREMVAR